MLLDSESSINLMSNPKLLSNIREAPNGQTMHVHCNAGTATTNLIWELHGFGTAWFCGKGIANVTLLSLVTDKFKVVFDSKVNDAFHTQQG